MITKEIELNEINLVELSPYLFRNSGRMSTPADPVYSMEPVGFKWLYVAELPVRSCYERKYWYYWGEWVFDIRELRKVAGIKLSWAFDEKSCNSYATALQMAKICQKNDFVSLIKPLIFEISFDYMGLPHLQKPIQFAAFKIDTHGAFQVAMSYMDEVGFLCCDGSKPLELKNDVWWKYLIVNDRTFQFWSFETTLTGYREADVSELCRLPAYLDIKTNGISKVMAK